MKEVLGIIPARYASTRFPGKPLVLIKNKPMIQWVYERSADAFDVLYVATDDQRIKDAVLGFGGRVVMTSPDHSSGTERCREAMDLVKAESGIDFSYVVNIQGDEPLIKPEQLKELVECIRQPSTDIATLIHPFEDDEDVSDPNKVKVVIDKYARALYFSRAAIPYFRDTEIGSSENEKEGSGPDYFKHIGLYAYTQKALKLITRLPSSPLEKAESLEQLRWLEHGFTIRTSISDYESIGVDTPEDLERLEDLM